MWTQRTNRPALVILEQGPRVLVARDLCGRVSVRQAGRTCDIGRSIL